MSKFGIEEIYHLSLCWVQKLDWNFFFALSDSKLQDGSSIKRDDKFILVTNLDISFSKNKRLIRKIQILLVRSDLQSRL